MSEEWDFSVQLTQEEASIILAALAAYLPESRQDRTPTEALLLDKLSAAVLRQRILEGEE